jgi:hypothetical protein
MATPYEIASDVVAEVGSAGRTHSYAQRIADYRGQILDDRAEVYIQGGTPRELADVKHRIGEKLREKLGAGWRVLHMKNHLGRKLWRLRDTGELRVGIRIRPTKEA